MDSFEKREEGFERAFSHREELTFKARVRRNRKLGAWAAEKLGLSGDAASAYAAALSERHFGAVGDDALVAELQSALEKIEPGLSEHRIRRRLEQFGLEAAQEIQAGR